MNTRQIQILVGVFLLLSISTVTAQTTFQFGGLSSVNVNKRFQNDWSTNLKIESRQLIQTGDFNGNVIRKYNYVLTDISLVAAKKVGLNSRVGGGYLLRVEGDEMFHRFIQQYIVVQRLSGFRLAHRFLCDQTFSKTEDPDFRARYRISSEIPLNGASVDPGECYLKINNEYVNSYQSNNYDLELRLVPLLGYDFSENFKMETGLDYRVNSFLSNNTRHSYWMTLNVFIEL